MSRPTGTKNIMRTPEEKEQLVLEYLNGNVGQNTVAASHNIGYRLFQKWVKKYQKDGIEGLKSKTGRKQGSRKGRPRKSTTEIEKLKEELLKKEIEIERLKKGYLVKGVGAKKEFVTTFKENTKL